MAADYQKTLFIYTNLRDLKKLAKELGLIQRKVQKINQTGLQLNRVRSRTRNIKGTGLNLGTSENRQAPGRNPSARVKQQTAALNKANAELNKYVRTLSTADGAQRGFTGSANKMSTQVSALRDRLRGLTRSNSEYRSTLQAVQRGEQALFQDRNKRLRDQANSLGRSGQKGGTGDLVTSLLNEDVVQSIDGLNNYASRLNALRDIVKINSTAFDQLSQKIVQVNEALEKTQFKKVKETTQKRFPQTELGSPQEFQQRQQFAEQRQAIEEQIANTAQRINDSKLKAVTKEKLLNDLKRSGLQLEKNQFKVAKQINIETQKNLAAQEKAQARRARITSSALIGGGFPLLFGGGPLQAIGGAIGGGIGESITPGGGFAGSIAVTAAVSSLGQFANSARKLAEAVKTTSGTLELMETRSLFSSDAIQKQAKALQEQGKEAELAALLTDELTKALGPAGLGQLAGLAEQSREMNSQFGILKTSMELFISGPLTELIKILNNVVGKANIVNQLDQSLSQLKKQNPNEFKRIIDQLKGSFVQNINPVSDRSKSVLGSFVNPSNLQVQGIPVGGFGKDILGQILQDVNKQLSAATLPFQTNLDTGSGGSNTSGGRKDFSEFELNILNKRIELQKLSGSLLDEEVVKAKRGIIFAEASLKFAQAEGDIGKNKIINAEKLLKLNQLDSEVNLAKGRDFAEKVIKPQMELLDKQEQAEFDAGAAIGKRLAPEIEMFNTLQQEVESMELMNQLQNAETVEQRVQIKLKLAELELGNEISDLNRKDIEDLIRKKEQQLENNKAIAQQKALQQQIEGILAGGMTNAVMGLIDGTRTLGQALADIAKQLASMFLNKAFMSIFSSFGGGGGPFNDIQNTVVVGKQGLHSRAGGFKAFQQGGVVNSPTLGMIGEGGEPEYVIPASKMDGAMSRYSAGARGGAVIPGGSGDSGTVAGSSGNTVVEYTGPTLNFNGDEYVPKSAVPEIIGAATKQGAMAGKAQVIGTLRNSRSQRASLGL